ALAGLLWRQVGSDYPYSVDVRKLSVLAAFFGAAGTPASRDLVERTAALLGGSIHAVIAAWHLLRGDEGSPHGLVGLYPDAERWVFAAHLRELGRLGLAVGRRQGRVLVYTGDEQAAAGIGAYFKALGASFVAAGTGARPTFR